MVFIELLTHSLDAHWCKQSSQKSIHPKGLQDRYVKLKSCFKTKFYNIGSLFMFLVAKPIYKY